MKGQARLGTVLALLYPLLVYLGLEHLEPREVGVLLLVLLLLRHGRSAGGFLRQTTGRDWVTFAVLVALIVGVSVGNSEPLLRLYPALVNAAMLVLFAASLLRPPSIIERFARLRGHDLTPRAVAYTQRVTQMWCGFFVVNGVLAGYTAFFATRAVWAWYNGFIAYLLIGTLLAGEWLFRRYWLKPEATG